MAVENTVLQRERQCHGCNLQKVECFYYWSINGSNHGKCSYNGMSVNTANEVMFHVLTEWRLHQVRSNHKDYILYDGIYKNVQKKSHHFLQKVAKWLSGLASAQSE